MKKILILYSAHYVNDFTIKQYDKLCREIPENYDIVWWLDDMCNVKLNQNIKHIIFPHNSISCKYGWFNPMKYMETYFLENEWFREYDYYWVIEYDVYFNGNWRNFFNTVDKYNEDLICSSLTMYNPGINIEFLKSDKFYNYFEKLFKSCLSIYRISNKGLNIIANYNECDIKNHIYEVYIPSIIYKNKLTLSSLNSERYIIEPNNHIYDYSISFINYHDDCGFIDDAVNTFWYNTTFYDESKMNKPNKLYTRYKEKQ